MSIPLIEDNALILFQGDSITDAGRLKDDPLHMGTGYASLIEIELQNRFSHKNIRCLNRGIGGNRLKDLRDRWDTDCLNLYPNWVSIMIGINETWYAMDSGDVTSPKKFEYNYRLLIEETQRHCDAKFILLQPFLLPVITDTARWREDLNPKIDIVEKIAQETNAILIKTDEMFNRSVNEQHPSYWALDGVHPTPQGHTLIAQAWLEALGFNNPT